MALARQHAATAASAAGSLAREKAGSTVRQKTKTAAGGGARADGWSLGSERFESHPRAHHCAWGSGAARADGFLVRRRRRRLLCLVDGDLPARRQTWPVPVARWLHERPGSKGVAIRKAHLARYTTMRPRPTGRLFLVPSAAPQRKQKPKPKVRQSVRAMR